MSGILDGFAAWRGLPHEREATTGMSSFPYYHILSACPLFFLDHDCQYAIDFCLHYPLRASCFSVALGHIRLRSFGITELIHLQIIFGYFHCSIFHVCATSSVQFCVAVSLDLPEPDLTISTIAKSFSVRVHQSDISGSEMLTENLTWGYLWNAT